MRNFESINKIKVYEKDGSEKLAKKEELQITVREHWNIKDFVVIEFEDFSLTVDGNALEKAISNARNTHRY